MTVKDNGVKGSLPHLDTLLQVTGPLDIEKVALIANNLVKGNHRLEEYALLDDAQLIGSLFRIIWILRGRNGWLEDNQTDA